MTKDWPGYGDTNADFWKHEWDKHGVTMYSAVLHYSTAAFALNAHQ